MQTKIPCVIMRGGTSRGPFFKLVRPARRRAHARRGAARGDGLAARDPGGRHRRLALGDEQGRDDQQVASARTPMSTTCSRRCRSTRASSIPSPTAATCWWRSGRSRSRPGWFRRANGETPVRIYSVNTDSLVEAIVQTPGRQVTYEGEASIDGVPGTAAPVGINFKDALRRRHREDAPHRQAARRDRRRRGELRGHRDAARDDARRRHGQDRLRDRRPSSTRTARSWSAWKRSAARRAR